MQYDPQVIDTYAAAMYAEAERIATSTAITWGIVGLLLGAGAGMSVLDSWFVGAMIGAGVGGFLGYKRGEAKGFALKLEAQTALCQVQIEKNTQKA